MYAIWYQTWFQEKLKCFELSSGVVHLLPWTSIYFQKAQNYPPPCFSYCGLIWLLYCWYILLFVLIRQSVSWQEWIQEFGRILWTEIYTQHHRYTSLQNFSTYIFSIISRWGRGFRKFLLWLWTVCIYWICIRRNSIVTFWGHGRQRHTWVKREMFLYIFIYYVTTKWGQNIHAERISEQEIQANTSICVNPLRIEHFV